MSLSVIICDLDHFKAINDSYGHHGRDAVLHIIAELLKKMTRRHIDSVVRYGGAEFADPAGNEPARRCAAR